MTRRNVSYFRGNRDKQELFPGGGSSLLLSCWDFRKGELPHSFCGFEYRVTEPVLMKGHYKMQFQTSRVFLERHLR